MWGLFEINFGGIQVNTSSLELFIHFGSKHQWFQSLSEVSGCHGPRWLWTVGFLAHVFFELWSGIADSTKNVKLISSYCHGRDGILCGASNPFPAELSSGLQSQDISKHWKQQKRRTLDGPNEVKLELDLRLCISRFQICQICLSFLAWFRICLPSSYITSLVCQVQWPMERLLPAGWQVGFLFFFGHDCRYKNPPITEQSRW